MSRRHSHSGHAYSTRAHSDGCRRCRSERPGRRPERSRRRTCLGNRDIRRRGIRRRDVENRFVCCRRFGRVDRLSADRSPRSGSGHGTFETARRGSASAVGGNSARRYSARGTRLYVRSTSPSMAPTGGPMIAEIAVRSKVRTTRPRTNVPGQGRVRVRKMVGLVLLATLSLPARGVGCAAGSLRSLPRTRRPPPPTVARPVSPRPSDTERSPGSRPTRTVSTSTPLPADATLPVVLWVHGGGYHTGDKRGAAANKVALFNRKGWVFASINYRLTVAGRPELGALSRSLRRCRDRGRLGEGEHRALRRQPGAGRPPRSLGRRRHRVERRRQSRLSRGAADSSCRPSACVGPLDTEGFDKVTANRDRRPRSSRWRDALGNNPNYLTQRRPRTS